MDFLEHAKNRYSCRKYKDTPVEREKILQVLEAGRIAPSAVNFQPWHFIVIDEADMRSKIQSTYDRRWFDTAPVVLVVCADHSQSWKRKDGKDHADIDAGIVTDHITLQAANLGLATCWVCNFDAQKCREILKLPEHIEPMAYLPLGYPDKDPADQHFNRKNIDEIVHWNKF